MASDSWLSDDKAFLRIEGLGVTDDVTNQPPPLTGGNAWRGDPLLIQLAERFSDPVRKDLDGLGRFVLTQEAQELARLANVETPKLRTHDRQGRRIDLVEFHPAYHALMRRSVANGLHSSVWENGDAEIGRRHQVRAARFYLTAELETGHLCPITMTSASLAALMASPKLFREWAPRVTTRKYDQSQKPPVEKAGLTLGMGMTEKQGGTDVRANVTRAERAGSGFYRLTGHKWFMSAPMSDAFLVLAQASDGLTCFFMPRFRSDGSENGLHFVKLKDKLGNRSNASSEVEFHNAYALRVGDEGRGIRTILQMVQLTRLDCAISSAGIMRAALARAVHHARYRTVFQRKLVDQPIMRAVLADLALDSEAAVAVIMRLCRSFDLARIDALEAARARVLTPVIKYWVCKMAPAFVYEAMECLGGNGYVEDYVLARLYREAPVNAIWEGSGNVMALDLLRALKGDDVHSVIDSLSREVSDLLDVLDAINKIVRILNLIDVESHARFIVEHLALIAAVAALQKSAPEIAEIFSQTRLNSGSGRTYGTSNLVSMTSRLLERVLPTSK